MSICRNESIEASHVTEQHHKPEIHMAVEKCQTPIVRREFHIHLRMGVHPNCVFHDAASFAAGELAKLKGVAVKGKG